MYCTLPTSVHDDIASAALVQFADLDLISWAIEKKDRNCIFVILKFLRIFPETILKQLKLDVFFPAIKVNPKRCFNAKITKEFSLNKFLKGSSFQNAD